MENEIRNLPAGAQLTRRVLRYLVICAMLLLINYLVTPGLNWSLWAVGGLAISLLFDLIDYFVIKHNKK